ncbi:MAG: methyltransferase [Prolixibacteraceae bacterium]|jgi:caffeoyl-CoA O-methyltransferase|nr:methyltransferase [Prolixibacteraceae bacterium]MBT6006966.1 methyltransferase [Prolixibacteraceae bacterium]MBT6764693.1 methyltransferase [Prolixibacteraceae bacterium]MBT6999830.1 methyltransferase [Prolixibacteraceae bacterium]MBT7393458.1 methyltransferase [Prolixibacteraceae bacterium]
MGQKEIDKYILNNIESEDEVLKELERETYLKVLHPRMISGHLQGQVLTMFSKMIQPENILEIGTFTGYSAICLAKGLHENGKLITIEIDDELETLAKKYIVKSGLQDKIVQRIGAALEIIPALKESFDLVFIDADKREYVAYYQAVFDKVQNGGYIIADNTLWSGKVLEKPEADDEQTMGILEFNNLIKRDKRVEKVILPLRDGMTIIRKK